VPRFAIALAVAAPVARRAGSITALLLLGALAACGGSTEPDAAVQPAAIRAEGGNNQTGRVGGALPVPVSVVVLDASNRPAPNVSVEFRAQSGGGSVSPPRISTGPDGRARATWTLGTTAGTQGLAATVLGLPSVQFAATATAGPATQLVVAPPQVTLPTGDTLRLQGALRDEFGNPVSGAGTVTWTSTAPAVATVDAQGTIRGIAPGTATIRAASTASPLTGQVSVTVVAPGASLCGTLPLTTLRVGEVTPIPTGATAGTVCVAADIGSGEFGLVAVSGATVFANTTPLSVTGQGLGAILNAIAAPAIGDASPALPSATGTLPPRDVRFEQALRQRERAELAPLAAARRTTAQGASPGRLLAFNSPRTATVGQLLTLNANANAACSAPDNRTGRVVAIGEKLIIVADTANPAGGYTDAEFRDIVAVWDSVIHPMDVQNFGEPSNISGYNKVIAFYTRAVNQLTPRGADFVIGGFFFARDLFPKTARAGFAACAASNEAEMMYLLVPDPTGSINGNTRLKDDVTRFNYSTLAHEYQHLINASRRLHVTPGGDDREEVWLDEGLAHTAEELLFYRLAGLDGRRNIDIERIRASTAVRDAFNNYGIQNFLRLGEYLANPAGNSPWAPNDQLATRGAIWQFLRFVAGRTADESAFYRRLADAPQSGIANLQANLPAPLPDLLRDFAVAQLADDVAAGLAPTFGFPSWNFRSVLLALRRSNNQPIFPSYPLPVRVLANGVPAEGALQGGGAGFYRFAVPAARTALLTVQANGAAPPPTVRLALVRLR
jgi:hypothetical protein